jgi:hypothetical protein
MVFTGIAGITAVDGIIIKPLAWMDPLRVRLSHY